VGLLGVGADPQDRDAALLELRVRVAEAARLGRAPGSVVPWIEVEDDRTAAKVGQAKALACVAGELEVGRRLPLVDHEREL
jgi:hypothetical protein